MFPKFSHVVTRIGTSVLFMAEAPWVDTLRFVCLFTPALGLFLPLGCDGERCLERVCARAGFCLDVCFHFSWADVVELQHQRWLSV